jgi:hypothetical protein
MDNVLHPVTARILLDSGFYDSQIALYSPIPRFGTCDGPQPRSRGDKPDFYGLDLAFPPQDYDNVSLPCARFAPRVSLKICMHEN